MEGQSFTGRLHFFSSSIAAMYKHLSNDSSVGKTRLPAVAFRNLLFTLSMMFVVYITRLISTGYLKNVVNASQFASNKGFPRKADSQSR